LVSSGVAASELDGLDTYVGRAVADWQVPGLAIAVVKDGEIVFERGYGVLELGADARVDENTLFSIGSTTKAMTAAALGMLVDEDKLAWSDRVVDHMPGFRLYDPYVTREVRVKDLLTHNAGLPNADFLWYEQDTELSEILERLRYLEPDSSMRSSYTYQNIMYAAAGRLIEIVSGQSWFDFIESRLFEPLGMVRSVPSLGRLAQRQNVAQPHDLVEGELVVIENASVDNVAAAGSVWSSVHEMAEWARFLLAGCETRQGQRLLEEQTCEELFRPQVIVDKEMYPALRLVEPSWLTYGLGWFQIDYRGSKVDFHSGSIDGMVALHGLIREQGLGVYVLANRDHAEVRHALMYRVFDLFSRGHAAPRDWNTDLKRLYDGLTEQAEKRRAEALSKRVSGTRPSLGVAAYVGRYEDPLYGELEVRQEAGELVLQYGRRFGELEHWEYDTFRADWQKRWRGSAFVTFVLGSGGEVVGARLNGMEMQRSGAAIH